MFQLRYMNMLYQKIMVSTWLIWHLLLFFSLKWPDMGLKWTFICSKFSLYPSTFECLHSFASIWNKMSTSQMSVWSYKVLLHTNISEPILKVIKWVTLWNFSSRYIRNIQKSTTFGPQFSMYQYSQIRIFAVEYFLR